MAITAKRYTPYTEVEFHTAQELYAVARGGGWANIQPTRDLISVQTSKQLSAPIGTWQVMLTGARGGDGMDWYDRLNTNDLVVIKMGRPPEMMGTPMVGLIDEVRRTKVMGADGSPERRVLVRGSDFGKTLAKAMLRFYPSLANVDILQQSDNFFKTGAGWQAMLNFFVGSDLIQGKPADMIRMSIVKILYRLMNVTYKYWDTTDGEKDIHLSNILRYRLADTKNIIPFLLTMLDYEGAFWNFIERISMKPFNELFIDTRGVQPDEDKAGKKPEYLTMVPNVAGESYYPDGDPLAQFLADNNVDTNPNWSATFGEDGAKVILYLRNTPFDYEDWNNLYTHTLEYGDDIISEDLGRSDHENYNVYMVTNSLAIPSSNNLKLLVHPVMDEDNAEKYGMSPLEVQLEGVSIEDEDLNAGIEASKVLSQRLYDWYKLNKDYKTGTITIRGNAFIKVGQRLIIRYCEYDSDTGKFDDLVFYIEGVTQNFTTMESWQTTVTLTRGQRLTTLKPSASASAAPDGNSETTTPNSRTYVVREGDTLWAIAAKFYGSGESWRKIWNANSEALIARDDRNKNAPGRYVYSGQNLIIPD